MIKRSFFGLVKPKLQYEIVDDALAVPVNVSASKKILLNIGQRPGNNGGTILKVGDKVKSCQKIAVAKEADDYLISSKSGQISNIRTFVGIMGKKYTSVTIEIDESSDQVTDDCFKNVCQTPSIENAREMLAGLPGKPDFEVFFNPEKPIKSIAVLGIDKDLLSTTNQYFVKNSIISIKTGIDLLRKITGIHNVNLIVPQYLAQVAGSSGATVKTVDLEYPSGNPHLVMRHILDGDKTAADSDVAFFTAEAVAAIGAAYNTGALPLEKIVSFIKKDGSAQLLSVSIGTPIQEILNQFNETLNDGDRLIIGGPMTGVSVYTSDFPVLPDTDTIIVQDKGQITERTDTACINCGECVRVCPASMQVNQLIRFLEAGQYEEAADQYDLFSCIECGFCSYVCESRIPVFQHIKLAKHTIESMKAAEENNA